MLEHRLEKRKEDLLHDKGNQRGMEKIRKSFLIYRNESNSWLSQTQVKRETRIIGRHLQRVNYENNLFHKSIK